MDLKKVAKKNRNLNALYLEILNWTNIRAEKSSGNNWGSHIDENGYAVVSYCKTQNQLAALAHELLHFKIQKEGYKRLRSVVSPPEHRLLAKRLLDALDNELQHHKMYDLYTNMGFLKHHFYSDDDAYVSEILNNELSAGERTFKDLVLPYLTLSAPGGHMANKEVQEFKRRFRDACAEPTKFDDLDTILLDWRSQVNMDAENTVSAVFKLGFHPEDIWIGYDNGNGFPDSGFYIGPEFTIDEYNDKYT